MDEEWNIQKVDNDDIEHMERMNVKCCDMWVVLNVDILG